MGANVWLNNSLCKANSIGESTEQNLKPPKGHWINNPCAVRCSMGFQLQASRKPGKDIYCIYLLLTFCLELGGCEVESSRRIRFSYELRS